MEGHIIRLNKQRVSVELKLRKLYLDLCDMVDDNSTSDLYYRITLKL